MTYKANGACAKKPVVLRLSLIALCSMVAACQRPTQMLPPAPMFEMPGLYSAPGQSAMRPAPRHDAMLADRDRFSQISRIYFERGSADLSDQARQILDAQAVWLRDHPHVRVSLQGHADAFGTREYQLALGERRAAAMKFHLSARGIGPDRLFVTSFGKQRPVASGFDDASQRSNRRGESILIGAPGASGF